MLKRKCRSFTTGKGIEHMDSGRISDGQPASRIPWIIGLGLCIAGFMISLYLAHLHWAVHTDFTYSSFCAINAAVNCEAVAESIFSTFLRVPVAVWGMLGYLLTAAVCLAGLARSAGGRRMWMIIYVLAAGAGAISIILFIISKFYLRSLCIMCLASYAVTFGLLALAMHMRSHRKIPIFNGFREDVAFLWQRRNITLAVAGGFLLAAVVLPAVYPQYWKALRIASPSEFHQGVTSEGLHWIGAENPSLTITEYSDYLCFYCRKSHIMLRRMLEKFPDKVRIVHRHFPMSGKCNPMADKDSHEGACTLAVWAGCAGKQGKFWEAHDRLFEIGRRKGNYSLADFAKDVGVDADKMVRCMEDGEVVREVMADIQSGLVLEGVTGTPFYVVEGKTYMGSLPLDLLRERLGKLN